MKGTRADVRLVELGLCQSREKARSLIMSGAVYINEVRIDKAGDTVPEDCVIENRTLPVLYQAPMMLEESHLSDIVCRELSIGAGKKPLQNTI